MKGEEQIGVFCNDFKIIWSKHFPDLSFGRLIYLIDNNDLRYAKNSEVIDRLLDLVDKQEVVY